MPCPLKEHRDRPIAETRQPRVAAFVQRVSASPKACRAPWNAPPLFAPLPQRYSEESVGSLEAVNDRMREDWDRRAREDASYYVAFGRRRQSREEFLSSAGDVLRSLREEYRRFPPGTDFRKFTTLEIGCGPGRLMAALSGEFGQVFGVDVSGEMVALAREHLRDIPHAEARQGNGADLGGFSDGSIDFCYSYAVFQHIPDEAVIRNYLREACRVLKPGGMFKAQLSGLPQTRRAGGELPAVSGWSARAATAGPPAEQRVAVDTWCGVSFRPEEIALFAAGQGMQLLAMDGFETQYLWVTWRKPSLAQSAAGGRARIVRVTNTYTADALIPRGGRFASASLWVLGLDEAADLNSLRVMVEGEPTAPCFIGKHVWKGPTQVNFYLPPGVRSGVLPVWLESRGEPISEAAAMRVVEPGPTVPKLVSVSDGVNLLSRLWIESRSIKVQLEEVGLESASAVRQQLRAEIGGREVRGLDVFCVDPLPQRYEVNLSIPAEVAAGRQQLVVSLGRRRFAPLEIQLAE
jgi:SAM-dependent methyltransferase